MVTPEKKSKNYTLWKIPKPAVMSIPVLLMAEIMRMRNILMFITYLRVKIQLTL